MKGIRDFATCVAAVLSILSLSVACATKLPESSASALTRQRLIESPAVVAGIDTSTRRLTVTTEDGARADVMLDPTVKNIDRISVGDRVVVSYYQGIAAEVRKPGDAARPTGAASTGTRERATVTVVAVDRQRETITVRGADGRTRTLNVVSEEGRQFIAGLRAGDEVDIAFTEAVAVGVRPVQ